MSNHRELRDARRKAEAAAASLAAIEALPQRVGQTVEWSNGVRWVRVGDDAWEPRHASDNYERPDPYPYSTYSSEHVALFRTLGE